MGLPTNFAAPMLIAMLSVGLTNNSDALAQQNSFGELLPPAKPAARQGQKLRPKRPAKKRQTTRRKKGVQAMFNDAQNLYKAGKYAEAIVIYDQILKRYNAHQPSMLQLAKSLYRLDRIADAYAIFARVSPVGLDAETSYEYGWSFYKAEQWQGALYGFNRVPKGHALFDLANYYGGICAIRLRQYEAAEEFLERAVVLPDKLAKSRKLYLKYVATLQLLKQKSELDAVRRKEKELLVEARKSAQDQPADKQGKPVTAEEEKHLGKKKISKAAKVSFSTQRQTVDFHGFKDQTYDVQLAKFSLQSGFMAPLPTTINERRAAAGLQLKLQAEDRNATGIETRVIIDESNEDLTRVLTTDPDLDHEKSGIVSAEPWVEFPLPEDVWLAVGGELYFTYPDFERQGRSGTRSAYSKLAGQGHGINYTAGISYTEVLNSDTDAIITVLRGDGTLSYDFEHNFGLSVEGNHELYDYLFTDLNLSGPDSLTALSLNATQGMPFGVELTGETGYLFLANNTVFGLPTYGQVSANGQTAHVLVSLSASPAPWFSAKIQQLFQKTTWEIDPAAAREVYELNVPDYLDEFTAEVSLNLAF